ncbi:MAG: ribosome maturation factor RimP [Ignavibacteriae bacterium]|nr:ribosome maturation factor RimP [Ignavibacteriota bacterium]
MFSETVLSELEAIATRQGAHVIDTSIRGSKNRSIIEIFVDAEGSVTSELCSEISRDAAKLFEERDIITGAYDLVVSSPGIDRPLKFPWQYKKHVGRKLSVTLTSEGKNEGKLVAADEDEITLDVGGAQMRIRFDAIREATVKAPW